MLKYLEITFNISKVKQINGIFDKYQKHYIIFGIDYDGILDYNEGWQKRIDIIIFNIIFIIKIWY